MTSQRISLFCVVLVLIVLLQLAECSRRRSSSYTSRRRSSYTTRRRSSSSRRRSSSSSSDDSSGGSGGTGYKVAIAIFCSIGGIFLIILGWCYYNQRKSKVVMSDSVRYNPAAEGAGEVPAKFPGTGEPSSSPPEYYSTVEVNEKKDAMLPQYEPNYDGASLPPPPPYPAAAATTSYPENHPPPADNIYT